MPVRMIGCALRCRRQITRVLLVTAKAMEISWANGATNIRNSCKTISLPAIFSSTISWHGGIRLRASNLLSSPTPLEDVQLDARKRQFIWSDAERLDIVQS